MNLAKLCTKCNIEKPFSEFGLRPANKDGYRSDCKACVAAYAKAKRKADPERAKELSRRFYRKHRETRIADAKKWRSENPERAKATSLRSLRVTGWPAQLASRGKAVARKRGWAFDLDASFVRALFEKQLGLCYWLGIALEPSLETRNPLQPSLDRIDCSKGYTRDNVVLACQFANMGRSAMSAERFKDFVVALKAHFVAQ